MVRSIARLILLVTLATVAIPVAAARRYTPLRPGPWFVAQELPLVPVAMNDRGQVVGYTESFEGQTYKQTPYVWSRGRLTPLGPYADLVVDPKAINNAGQVAGRLLFPPDARDRRFSLPFIWQEGVYHVPPLGPGTLSRLLLNNRGLLVGSFAPACDAGFLFQWRVGEPTLPVQFPGYRYAEPAALNDHGAMAAHGYTDAHGGDSVPTAFLWDGEHGTALPSLEGSSLPFRWDLAALNNHGVVVGVSYSAQAEEERPVRWVDGRVELLADAGGGATDINDAGWIVGMVNWEGFLWTPREGLLDLRQRLLERPGRWRQLNPVAINERGQILAFGYGSNVSPSVLLTPLPASHSR